MKQHHQDESILFSIDEGKTETFLRQRGLEIVEHLDNQEIERGLLMDETGSLIGRIPALFRFAIARPGR